MNWNMSASSKPAVTRPVQQSEAGPLERRIVEMSLEGHLTERSLAAALAGATKSLRSAGGGVGLIVDCTTMTSYDLAARGVFVEWNKASRGSLRRLAILTTNSLWRMVISVMALAAGTEMKPFGRRSDALDWLAA
jgi:hypothetical protein